MTTLEEFLVAGKLGPIPLAATEEAVLAALGEPSAISVQKNHKILKYGALQLGFCRPRGEEHARLDFIGLYFWNADQPVPTQLGWTGWLPTGQTTVQEFLAQCGPSVRFQTTALDQNDCLETEAGVQIAFAEGCLQKILLLSRLVEPVERQVSVRLPEPVIEKIRQEAATRKTSVSSVCRELLIEKVDQLSAPPIPAQAQ